MTRHAKLYGPTPRGRVRSTARAREAHAMFLGGAKYREIAAHYGVREQTVYVWLRSVRDELVE